MLQWRGLTRTVSSNRHVLTAACFQPAPRSARAITASDQLRSGCAKGPSGRTRDGESRAAAPDPGAPHRPRPPPRASQPPPRSRSAGRATVTIATAPQHPAGPRQGPRHPRRPAGHGLTGGKSHSAAGPLRGAGDAPRCVQGSDLPVAPRRALRQQPG